jgi:hypothetical protein
MGSAFASHVLYVLKICSDEKMLWINAGWGIATVANAHAISGNAGVHFP